ncbi:MAG: hypothetical protein E7596_08260 [Ruminococcaceae bacterium]|nr:hypothetical protein [Oscillospiraceae bacterium]
MKKKREHVYSIFLTESEIDALRFLSEFLKTFVERIDNEQDLKEGFAMFKQTKINPIGFTQEEN